jgi:Bacterial Ig-like domain (group 1)
MRRQFDSAALKAVLAALLVLASCVHSDTIAPDGATIDLSATPAQVVLSSGVQTSPVSILATVRDTVGVPLPGQDVRFTTSSGILDPPAGTPVTTDNDGNAIVTLTGATTGPTITAKSGKASATLTLNAGTGELSTILLSPSPLSISNCSDTKMLTATALGPSGTPVEGVSIAFVFVDTGATFLTGTFDPNPDVSDVNGEVVTTVTFVQTDCQTKCGSGNSCSGRIQAQTIGGGIKSNEVNIIDQVP